MSSAAITVDNVSKRYRLYHERNASLKASILNRKRVRYEEFWALRDVSLEIPAGTTYGLIGANGSGKSTLLKCMARILRPDSGSIGVVGKVSALLELGAGFHPELSGRENVFLNGSILGLGRRELSASLDEIVSFSGLEEFIDMPVKTYSSGMYVRLGFAVAVNVDPDVLLVDEVLAVGDEEFQRRCDAKFAQLKASGRTIVVVSHALDAIRNLCDQVAWLEHGVVKEIGVAGHVVDNYVGGVRSTHGGRPDGAVGTRWGTGEATIDRVEILDAEGRPAEAVPAGEPATIRLHWSAPEPIRRPVFGIGLRRGDGVHLTGPNTKEAGQIPDRIEGSGHVDLRIPRLLLLPGAYEVSAVVCDESLTREYDHRHRTFGFDVVPGSLTETLGLISLGGEWSLAESQGSRPDNPPNVPVPSRSDP